MNEDEIFEFWFEQNSLAESTRKRYQRIVHKYCEFLNKTVETLYKEAVNDEKTNVFLPERTYSKEVLRYKRHLKELGKSKGTIKVYINTLKSFYNALSVKPPKISFKSGDFGLEKNFGHLLSKDEINELIAVSGPRDRAIMYTMATTGMSQREIRDLKIDTILKSASKALKRKLRNVEDLLFFEEELRDVVLTLEIRRQKVNYRYITFLAPEALTAILLYFKERQGGRNKKIRITGNYDFVFRSKRGYQMTDFTVTKLFQVAGMNAGFEEDHEPNAFRSWRSHGMRRYFISTVINKTGNHVAANFMAGHKISEQDRTYWRADPDDLKEIYLEALPFLSLENVEVKTVTSEDLKVIEQLQDENKSIRKENKEIKEYFELLKRRNARSKS